MKAGVIFGAVAAALIAAPAARAGDAAMQSALQELQTAHRHLQQADKDYDGHRRAALERVEKAIDEVKQGLAVAGKRDDRKDQHLERRENQLERRDDRIDRRLDDLRERRERLDE
jgi:flagellar motility protein MotE (MotC chaperone)